MPPEPAPPPRLGPRLVTGIGLLLAIAGTLAAPDGAPLEGLGTRVFVPLPDWLIVGTMAAVALASLIFIARSLPGRPPGKDEFERYDEPQKLSPILAVLLIVLALTPGVILGATLYWIGLPDIHPRLAGITADAAPSPAIDERPVGPASPVTTGLIGTLALLAAFGSLGVVSWLCLAGRLHRGTAGATPRHSRLAAAVEDSLEDLRREPDARTAIIKIYRNFERVLATAALPRRPWQTPVEFMRAVLGKAPLPPDPVRSLTGLFELARFSQHPVGAAERESAWRSLIEIRTALDRERQTPDAAIS
jgi:hypothetical protein